MDAHFVDVIRKNWNDSNLCFVYNARALLISTDGDVQISPDWHHAVSLAA